MRDSIQQVKQSNSCLRSQTGVLLAAPLYGPWNGALALAGTLRSSDTYIYSAVALWAFAEFSNAIVHLHLRSLRPAGSKARAIPTGYGFGLVSCPNYFFEAIAWIAFTGLTMDWAGKSSPNVASVAVMGGTKLTRAK